MNLSRYFRVLVAHLFLMFGLANCCAQERVKPVVSIEPTDGGLAVWIANASGKELFAEFQHESYRKPILYPVLVEKGVSITRHFPMDDSHESEAQDHPHHKSIWFAHGDMNGVDFWSEKGVIKTREIVSCNNDRIVAINDWFDGEEKVCEDRTTIRFLVDEQCRTIDFSAAISATGKDLVFGDTKEGTFAIRTHPALRLVGKDGRPSASALNSQGVTGKAIWGKKASWVHYSGSIDGRVYGVTIMDHPENLRHPTTWHAREYGLVAANPFGLHHFSGVKKGDGNFTLPAGQTQTFHYAVLFWKGPVSADQINQKFLQFSDR